MNALIVYGGWEGHDPEGVSSFLEGLLQDEGFKTTRTADVEALSDSERLKGIDLVVPVVTMAQAPPNGFGALFEAIENGTGLAGCHGGMCDSFRSSSEWQFLTGGQFVAHPGDITRYRVEISDHEHSITFGMRDFEVETEQYYMHVDPALHVLATSRAPAIEGPFSQNPRVDMPVSWVKRWGAGRVFYLALGHSVEDLEAEGPRELMRRGMLWSSGSLS
jgi:hypothetical protein